MPRTLWLLLLLLGLAPGACAGPSFQAVPAALSEQLTTGDRFMGIRLLGVLRLPPASIDGQVLQELSGLAWDEDAGLLYAVSDRGTLFHLRVTFKQGVLSDVEPVAALALQGADGKPLRPPFADAEGLAIRNGNNGIADDSELVISFEVQVRIARYTPSGQWLGEATLPAPLQNVRAYANSNKALEAVTSHPQWGILTAPERPLRAGPPGYVPIYALDGRFWSYPLYPAPESSVVALEALPDGSLLVLERAFASLLQPLVISLRHTRLPAAPGPLQVDNVAVFDTSQGWLLDNFEGLTRHRDRYFFMVSDDSSHALQSTLLVYFELLPEAAREGR